MIKYFSITINNFVWDVWFVNECMEHIGTYRNIIMIVTCNKIENKKML